MRILFFNGPVQNGNFTLEDTPGKAVGIRIAEALNRILDAPPVPHLWNTVTLAGDLRYRRHTAAPPVARADFESALIAAKYGASFVPRAGTVTDADSEVTVLAKEMIESRLADGTLRISREITRQCAGCGHMVGTGSHPCNACGSTVTRDYAARHLVAERAPGRPVLAHEHLYAHKRRLPQHLCDIAGNAPRRLILSRTRDHGISLEPLGLQRAVLDPRVGVHITVLAAAVQRRADVAVMTTTQNAAANIAAYGQLFREHAGLRLLYALHGRVPYEHIARQREVRESRQVDTAARSAFETWFLPLYSLKEKSGVRADQLPALSRYFRRALLARPAQPGAAVLRDIRRSVTNGDLDWVMRQNALAHVMRL